MGRKSLLRCYSGKAFYRTWRQESCFYGNYNMKLLSRLKMGATLGIGIFSLSLYAVAGDHGHKNGHGHNSTTPGADPKPTPPGNHYGWDRGRHNPHHSADPAPTPGTDVSPTPTPSGSATPSPTVEPSASPSATP